MLDRQWRKTYLTLSCPMGSTHPTLSVLFIVGIRLSKTDSQEQVSLMLFTKTTFMRVTISQRGYPSCSTSGLSLTANKKVLIDQCTRHMHHDPERYSIPKWRKPQTPYSVSADVSESLPNAFCCWDALHNHRYDATTSVTCDLQHPSGTWWEGKRSFTKIYLYLWDHHVCPAFPFFPFQTAFWWQILSFLDFLNHSPWDSNLAWHKQLHCWPTLQLRLMILSLEPRKGIYLSLAMVMVLKSNQEDKIKDKISGCPHRTNG